MSFIPEDRLSAGNKVFFKKGGTILEGDDHVPNPLASWWRAIFGRRRISSERELQEMIEESEAGGFINEEEGEMLHSIFELGETIVREVMVPRTAMTCCSLDAEFSEMLRIIQCSGHSRIPVFSGSVDEIVGVVHSQDLLRFWGREPGSGWLQEIMKKPLFVPETMSLEQLLREFRRQRARFAIVIDEYGGTSGLVTFSDLVEEIVGDVGDEDEEEDRLLLEEGEGFILVDGRFPIDDLEEFYDITIAKEKFDTVSGWLFHLLGHVPTPGEEARFGSLRMTVVEADSRRIGKVKIELSEDGQEPLAEVEPRP
ncbi:MAG: HlyC/CorC family transporter [Desulfuromonadaceae bacterium]|nr:HlyC/CorC family transporter [Desulfuromonadaceae bacterium]